MPEVLAQSHIVCLPSYREGLPKALLEAASSGRPIVTTDTVGCREVVVEGENGFLVPVFSTHALADALQKLIENPILRQQLGAKGRDRVLREFTVAKVIAETLDVYAELVSERPGRVGGRKAEGGGQRAEVSDRSEGRGRRAVRGGRRYED